MKNRLEMLRKKEKRLVVGIETGVFPARWGAAIVEVAGHGDETVLALRGFKTYVPTPELAATLDAINHREQFDSEELASINFLVLHHLTHLYQELIESCGLPFDVIDIVGLKCLEVAGFTFPTDPAVFSEMIDRIVASRFFIRGDGRNGEFLPVQESLLQGMVGEMIDRFGLDNEVREAAAVALLANESVFNDGAPAPHAAGKGSSARKAAKMPAGAAAAKSGKACLCGEFFFPR